MIELTAGVQRDTQHFRHLHASHVEGFVNQFEHHANWTISQHPRIDEVRRRIELVVGPEAVAANAARRAGGVIVHAFAQIHVIVVDHVPIVED